MHFFRIVADIIAYFGIQFFIVVQGFLESEHIQFTKGEERSVGRILPVVDPMPYNSAALRRKVYELGLVTPGKGQQKCGEVITYLM